MKSSVHLDLADKIGEISMLCRRTVILAVTIAVILPMGSFGQEPKEHAFDKLKGVWVADEILSSGNKVPREKFPFDLHFEEDKLTFKFVGAVKGKDRVHDLTLDDTSDPFKMDFTRSIGDERMTVHAIYKFEGDRLLICTLRDATGQPSKERASSFDSNSTVRSDLLILKRKPTSDN